jgi:hypothetical protein
VQGRLLYESSRGRWGKLVIYPLIAPGVVLHELGHAFAAIVSGAGIARMSLFHPRQLKDGSAVLGYVQQRYEPRLPGGQILIATAPLLLPPLALYALALPLLHASSLSPEQVFSALGSHLASWGALLWIFLFASMTLSNFPSDQDFRTLGLLRWPLLVAALLAPMVAALSSPALAQDVSSLYWALGAFLAPSLAVCLLAALLTGQLREL